MMSRVKMIWPLNFYFSSRQDKAPDGTLQNFSLGSCKNFESLVQFFRDYPSICTSTTSPRDLAALSFGLATSAILDSRRYEGAEYLTNVGLLAELYASRGIENVDADIQLMMDKKDPKMKDYLRQLHVEMKDKNCASSLTESDYILNSEKDSKRHFNSIVVIHIKKY
jgi:hypothetical protein